LRAAPFTPLRIQASESMIDDAQGDTSMTTPANNNGANVSPSPGPNASGSPNANSAQNASANSAAGPPEAYVTHCSACHGTRGQGAAPFRGLMGVSAKPRRTVEDIIGLLNNPEAYGIQPPMKSFATQLTEDEKRAIAEWVATLKKR
jgi:mono/diheme cytochrome c family protein